MRTNQTINNRIAKLVKKVPFCFKDPRFSYTLPIWKPFIQDTTFICVFREPALSAHSIFNEIKVARHLKNFSLTLKQILDVWLLMHSHILKMLAQMNHGFLCIINKSSMGVD